MKTKKYYALFAIICCVSSIKASADVPHILPDLTLPMLDGVHELKLNNHSGKVVYIDIWASGCTACILAMPDLKKMQSDIDSEGFELLSITVDHSRRDAQIFLQKLNLDIPSAIDEHSAILTALSVTGLPAGLLVDATGRVRLFHQGYRPGQSAFIKAYIEKLLQERAVATDGVHSLTSRY